MNQVQIVTDSTADLPEKLVKDHNIAVVPLKVIFNGKDTYRDGVDISTEQFYQRLVERRETATTSQPTPGEFVSVYTSLSAKSIISIHLSSVMSGTCQSARIAREMVPGADIEVVDSKSVSMGLGLIVLEAARAAGKGMTKGEILKIISDLQARLQVFFIVDSLEYLARGGRIGMATAFLGTILNIKPLLYLSKGQVQPYEKIRGKTKAIERLAQIVEEKAAGQKIKCSIVHGMDPEGMEKFCQKIKAKLHCAEPVISKLGAVVGTHTGPGVVGIVFAPDP
ncbi:MAG: DegV family protein [Pelotomaculaceae bacterium]|jgi:DegV family protein with EDD domain|uniref:DegV domain-containing protein n=1 Tax=anaerobic digester metagenome TaxID=1263854 RepID=A0A485M6L2_9ZZZZ|nr:DegV family protein [Bacillota bacterium]HHU85323.1 DegV family protein [Peptococcaceae bacterium]